MIYELFVRIVEPFLPTPQILLTWSVPLLVLVVVTNGLVGMIRTRLGFKVPYTRKLYHGLVFTTAGILQLGFNLRLVSLYGTIVVGTIGLAILREDESSLYQALARPTDVPHRTLFVVVPMIATGLGGVLSNLWFGAWAVSGYLACGLGDAVAEPVGERWGYHPYSVPSLAGVSVERTLEGSLSVFVFGTAAVFGGLLYGGVPMANAAWFALAGGLVGTATEAVSHHGLDNLTIQLAVSGTVYLMVI